MKYILLLYITTFILHVHNVDGKTTSRSHPSSHVKRRSRVQKLRQALNITTSDILDADNKTTSNTVLKQNIAYSSPDELVGQNETQANGEKKGTFENAQKKVEVRTKSIDSKGMSAIVVIGNRTHRVSGPVVKELLAELQKQNEDEEKSKKSVENGQVGQSGASNLRRIYAANEVAEINRLLGKPLTDAKALGLIKNLLLDRVHTHLAKTMETNQIFDPSQPDLPSGGNNAMSKDALHPAPEQCVDEDSKEKCSYLKDLGLCKESSTHPYIQRRCADTCELCHEPIVDTEPIPPNPLPPLLPPCPVDCAPPMPCAATCAPPLAAPVAPLAILPPPPPIAPIQIALPSTPRPCPITCGLPPTLPPIAIQPCPTTCPNHRRTTPYPIVIRRTTPRPFVVLADNTPVPHVHVPIFRPTFPQTRIMTDIECSEHIDIVAVPHRRPVLCPQLIRPATLCPQFGRLTTLCPPRPTLCPQFGRLTTMCPPRPTTLCPMHFGRRTTMCPPMRPTITGAAIIELQTTMQPVIVARTTIVPIIHPTTPPLIHHHTTFIPLLRRRTTMFPFPTALPHLPIGLPISPLISGISKCSQAMDIGLAVDSSAAVVPHWHQIQQFLKQLVDRFQMNGVSRIGLIQFDTIAKMPVRLDTCQDAPCLKQYISKLAPDPYGRRRTDAALDMAKEKLFAQGRSGIPKVLFVLEHGKINGGDPSINWGQMLVEPAQRLKDAGVNVFAVGTTPIATEDELKTITSADQSHIVPLQSYGQLPGAVSQIARKACQIAVPPNEPAAKDEITRGPFGCEIDYAKLGCYNDDQNNPRPLPDQILNDRGKEFENYSGKPIDYDHWEAYSPEFVCRCAVETKKRGFKVFGVQFFASCWSGQNADQTYMEDGEGDPDLCISNSKDYRKCEATDQVCVGKQETNFVYTLDTEAKRSEIPHGHAKVKKHHHHHKHQKT